MFPNLVSKDSNLYTCNVFDTTKSMAPELVSVQMNVASGVCVCVLCVCTLCTGVLCVRVYSVYGCTVRVLCTCM